MGAEPLARLDGERLLWMAPALQVDSMVWRLGRVQSSVRPVDAVGKGLLALMESANRVPFCFSGCHAFDIRRVVPVPGLTGVAITSRRSHNSVKLISSAKLQGSYATVGLWAAL